MQKLSYLALLIIFSNLSFAQNLTQSQRDLEKQKQSIINEIKAVQERLNNERTKELSLNNQLQERNRKIELSNNLINTIKRQINSLESEINKKQKQIDTLNSSLNVLKADYGTLILKSYKSRSSQSRLMFIFSSENFNQAFKRIQYMKQYANYRKSQGEEIVEKTKEIEELLRQLDKKKDRQRSLLAESQNQKKQIEKDIAEKERLVSLVKKEQDKLNSDIKNKQQKVREIDRKIQQLIKMAIAEANKREAAKKKGAKRDKSTSTSAKFLLTPEGKLVSDSFIANRGKLPWPVTKGYVSLKHGEQPHPQQPQLTIYNSGIEITVPAGINARSIFNGEVLQVQVFTDGNKAILIRHGDFITVYQNLNVSYVKKGDKVKTKQNIGTIKANSEGKFVLKFLISQNTNIQNPQNWLGKM